MPSRARQCLDVDTDVDAAYRPAIKKITPSASELPQRAICAFPRFRVPCLTRAVFCLNSCPSPSPKFLFFSRSFVHSFTRPALDLPYPDLGNKAALPTFSTYPPFLLFQNKLHYDRTSQRSLPATLPTHPFLNTTRTHSCQPHSTVVEENSFYLHPSTQLFSHSLKPAPTMPSLKALLFAGLLAVSTSAQSCQVINSIQYCEPVDSVTYTDIAHSGTYSDIVGMDGTTCACNRADKPFSGTLTPLDEQV